MPNNQEWQRRTDEWIKMQEASSRRKHEKKLEKERKTSRGKGADVSAPPVNPP